MKWLRRIFHGSQLSFDENALSGQLLEDEIRATHRKVIGTFAYALGARDPSLGIVEHCALVSLVASQIAQRIGVSEADAYILRSAAQLHEIGMITVPPELLERPAPLASHEVERVRSQAAVSAEIVRAVHPPRVAALIEHQYEDYRALRRRMQLRTHDLLLAGIFRVADVLTAVTWPRPYQQPLPVEFRREVLQSGAGTRFHPLAVHFALQLWRSN